MRAIVHAHGHLFVARASGGAEMLRAHARWPPRGSSTIDRRKLFPETGVMARRGGGRGVGFLVAHFGSSLLTRELLKGPSPVLWNGQGALLQAHFLFSESAEMTSGLVEPRGPRVVMPMVSSMP